jgi:putative heme degradation protein
MRLVLGLCIAAALIPALAPRAVEAAAGAPEIVDNWANMDRCYKESFAKFPDFTKEAELARQQFVRKCQVRYSLGTSRPLIIRQP